jgi:ribosomal protein S16
MAEAAWEPTSYLMVMQHNANSKKGKAIRDLSHYNPFARMRKRRERLAARGTGKRRGGIGILRAVFCKG